MGSPRPLRCILFSATAALYAVTACAEGEAWVASLPDIAGPHAGLGCGDLPFRNSAPDTDGNLLVAGSRDNPASASLPQMLYAAKLSQATGAPIWQFTRTGAADSAFIGGCLSALRVGRTGDVFVVGSLPWPGTDMRPYAARLSASTGSLLWERVDFPTDAAPGWREGDDVAVDPAGDIVVMARGTYAGRTLTKLSAVDGAVLWNHVQPDTADAALAVDSHGDVIFMEVDSDASACHVSKLRGNDGSTAWTAPCTARYPNRVGVLLDAANNVVAYGPDIVSYAGADGSPRWQRSLATSAQPYNLVNGAILAPNGDLLLTAQMPTTLAMRVSASSGATIWSTDPSSAAFVDIALTRAGQVAVSVLDYGVGQDSISTTKYDFESGSPGESHTYAPISQYDHGRLSVLPSPGAIFVTYKTTVMKYDDQATAPPVYLPPLAGTMPRKRAFDLDGKADVLWRTSFGYAASLMDGVAPSATSPAFDLSPGAVLRIATDIDGDGRTDLVLRYPDGRYVYWLMNGTTQPVVGDLLAAGSGWDLVGAGRFDGNAIPDLVWRHTSGAYGMWLLKDPSAGCCAGQPSSAGMIATPGAGFEVVQVGDFDGDGKDDLLWRHPDGRVFVALMDGMTATSSVQVLNAGTGWTPVLLGDFNGDGKADIVWRHDNGSYGIWLMNGTSISSYAAVLGANTGWTATLVGDLDGDGKHDIVWGHTNGSQGAWLMDGTTIKAYGALVGAGSTWQVVRADDFDADGKADLLWRNTATNQYGTWLMDGLAYKSYGSVSAPPDWSTEP